VRDAGIRSHDTPLPRREGRHLQVAPADFRHAARPVRFRAGPGTDSAENGGEAASARMATPVIRPAGRRSWCRSVSFMCGPVRGSLARAGQSANRPQILHPPVTGQNYRRFSSPLQCLRHGLRLLVPATARMATRAADSVRRMPRPFRISLRHRTLPRRREVGIGIRGGPRRIRSRGLACPRRPCAQGRLAVDHGCVAVPCPLQGDVPGAGVGPAALVAQARDRRVYVFFGQIRASTAAGDTGSPVGTGAFSQRWSASWVRETANSACASAASQAVVFPVRRLGRSAPQQGAAPVGEASPERVNATRAAPSRCNGGARSRHDKPARP